MDIGANSVAGTHRATKSALAWFWGSMGFIWLMLSIVGLRSGHDAVRTLFNGALAVAYLLLAWATTRAHTLVDENGIRVSNGIGGRRVGWGAITSVSKVDRWDPPSTLTVTTDAGKDVLTHVSKTLREDFIEYANGCRSSGVSSLD